MICPRLYVQKGPAKVTGLALDLMPIHGVSTVGPVSRVKGQSGVALPGWHKLRQFLQFLADLPALARHGACLRGIMAEQPLVAGGLDSPLLFQQRVGSHFHVTAELPLRRLAVAPSQSPSLEQGLLRPWGLPLPGVEWPPLSLPRSP